MPQSHAHVDYERVPPKALALSAGALAVPVTAAFLFPAELGEQQPLLWLLALVPAFLLAYYRGWRGAALAMAGGMALLAGSHAVALAFGRPLPDTPLALAVIPVFLAIALGIGWTTELLHRRFSLAQESSSELNLLISPDGSVRSASASLRHLLGHDPRQVVGHGVERLLEPNSATELLSRLEQLEDGDSLELSFRVSGDASVRVLDVVVHDRRTVRGLRGYVLRGRDVTERRKAEELSRRAATMLAIAGLARQLAHDFNNALTTIRANADLLREDAAGNRRVERRLSEIEGAAERSARFVEMLLAFSRQQVLRPRSLRLGVLLTETRSKLEDLLGPGVSVTVDVDADVPDIYFDAVRLRQILLILASRARAGLADGGRFAITATAGEINEADATRYPYPVATGEYAVVTVSDDGRAMSRVEAASIFDPFCASVSADATGLELSSVYGTIKQAGGYVWVDSGPAGTAFRMFLPIAAVPLPLLSNYAPSDRTGKTVLVAEDDSSVRAIVCETLLRRGYYVIEACDGEDALQAVDRMGGCPDALITDLLMPKIGGRDLAQEMTRRYGSFPVLYITGYTQESLMAESMLLPGETLLCKPFSASTLADALQEVMEGSPYHA